MDENTTKRMRRGEWREGRNGGDEYEMRKRVMEKIAMEGGDQLP